MQSNLFGETKLAENEEDLKKMIERGKFLAEIQQYIKDINKDIDRWIELMETIKDQGEGDGVLKTAKYAYMTFVAEQQLTIRNALLLLVKDLDRSFFGPKN